MNEKFNNTCLKCNRIFTKPESLHKHLKKIHCKGDDSMNKYKCFECDKILSNFFSLKRHIEKCHPTTPTESKKDTKSEYLFSCSCGNNFTYKHHFQFHKRTCHNDTEKRKNKKCPLCHYMGADKKEMVTHFKEKHHVMVKTRELQFASFENFKEWKAKIEAETYSWYIRNSTTSGRKVEKTYYYCHRSGQYKTQGVGLRKLKVQGSKKINGYCPAGICLLKHQSGHCKIVLTETHVGHDNEIYHTILTPSERNFLEQMITSKVPFEEILNEIRSKQGDKLKRLDLVLKKDLFNIRDRLKAKAFEVNESNKGLLDFNDDEEFESEIKEILSKSTEDECKEKLSNDLNKNEVMIKNLSSNEMLDIQSNSYNDEISISDSLSSKYINIFDDNCNGELFKNITTKDINNYVINAELAKSMLLAEPACDSIDELNFNDIVNSNKESSLDLYNDISEVGNSVSDCLFEDLDSTICNDSLDNISKEKSNNTENNNVTTEIHGNNIIDDQTIINDMDLNSVTETELILNSLNINVIESLDEEKKCILESFSKQLVKVDSATKLRILKTIVDSLSFILNTGQKANCLDFSITL